MPARINEHFLNLKSGYLFAEIARRVKRFQEENPQAKLIRMGIGDVTRPLPPAVIDAFQKGVAEMAAPETFRGYGPDQGYSFLIRAIIEHDYNSRGIDLSEEEVFISDGAKSDTGNFQEIFGLENTVAVTDPVYPVYVDSNIMAGRGGRMGEDGRYERIVYLPSTEENGFVPALPAKAVDLIYLCLPNNPTGTTLTKEQLKVWVDYARANRAIILFDSAYEAYIREDNVPHSIFEIEGAREVAVEFRSFSKTAGFTGTRCAYTVVPKEAVAYDASGRPHALNPLWNRRQATKFNGVSYPVQVAAAAVYSPEGWRQARATIDYYMENARLIRESLSRLGLRVYGGVNAPYIWVKTPGNLSSWDLFDRLLAQAHVVCTPGAGFGPSGEGYLRLTAFGRREDAEEAMARIARLELA